MKEISVFYKIFKHFYMKLVLLLNSNWGRFILFITAAIASLTTLQTLLIIFFATYTIDFITGIIASYIEVKNGIVKRPKSGLILESKKMRQSVVKLIGYGLVILTIYTIDSIFFNSHFDLSYVKTKNLTLTDITVAACAAIEIYSALVENLKRAGFDIIGKISTIADTIWGVIKKIKGDG